MSRFDRFALAVLGLATVALYGGRAALALRDVGLRPQSGIASAEAAPARLEAPAAALLPHRAPVAPRPPARAELATPLPKPAAPLQEAALRPDRETPASEHPRKEHAGRKDLHRENPGKENPDKEDLDGRDPGEEDPGREDSGRQAAVPSAGSTVPGSAVPDSIAPDSIARGSAADESLPEDLTREEQAADAPPPVVLVPLGDASFGYEPAPDRKAADGADQGDNEPEGDVATAESPDADMLESEMPQSEMRESEVPGTTVDSMAELAGKFREADYRFEDVAAGIRPVPRIIIRRFPPDLRGEESAEARKLVFLQTLLPIVLYKNQEIRRDRERLLALAELAEKGGTLPADDAAWLSRLCARYKVEDGDIDELLIRVDVIPPSLALAQAATESGWGTSRSAQEDNALFGQYADNGDSYAIRSFDALLKSAQSYALNLNTHRAYREMRERRAQMRAAGQPLDGYALAATLDSYSERGKKYVQYVRKMIRNNRLGALDRARLAGDDAHVALR